MSDTDRVAPRAVERFLDFRRLQPAGKYLERMDDGDEHLTLGALLLPDDCVRLRCWECGEFMDFVQFPESSGAASASAANWVGAHITKHEIIFDAMDAGDDVELDGFGAVEAVSPDEPRVERFTVWRNNPGILNRAREEVEVVLASDYDALLERYALCHDNHERDTDLCNELRGRAERAEAELTALKAENERLKADKIAETQIGSISEGVHEVWCDGNHLDCRSGAHDGE